EIFKAWDKHADQIRYVSFAWLNDLSWNGTDDFGQYYGYSERKFLELLRTLGLRTYEGKDKEAFKALNEEAKARGL
ncbi:hypothetical protein HYY71_05790, partial [Candidatus Woesearchaeota archaeon]|nr:hypothetical protein [Candidatus Woesearchaeota archaeon]